MMENQRHSFWQKAQENLASGQSEYTFGRYNVCANRLCYTSFHAVIVALLDAGVVARQGRRSSMSAGRIDLNDARVTAAMDDLKQLIAAKYPGTTFDVFEGEDPEGIYLRAVVDIEDSSDALVPVLDKLYELEVEQELPIYVVTSQPMERIAAQIKASPIESSSTVVLQPL